MTPYSYLFEYRRTPLRGYERQLGHMEVEALAGKPRRTGDVLKVSTLAPLPLERIRRVTFFERVTQVAPDGLQTELIPDQVLLEKSTRAVRASTPATMAQLLSRVEETPNAGREHTYLSHAWHQYKGKFYPQLVRSSFVIAGLEPGMTVLDPFAGSGTTLVETYLSSLRGYGVDLNPLAAYLSGAKIECLALSPEEVEFEIDVLTDRLVARLADAGIDDELLPSEGYLPRQKKNVDLAAIPNLGYLSRWFDRHALQKLAILLEGFQQVSNERIRQLLLVTLSNLLREFSLQDPQQLRIQRRKDSPRTRRLLYRFVVDLRRNARAITAMTSLRQRLGVTETRQTAIHADARRLKSAQVPDLRSDERIDLVVTSPPYATALPYIDTDRLSLFLLGLLKPSERAALDSDMIGNREIRDRERQELESRLEQATVAQSLPPSVLKLVLHIRDLNRATKVGFRRRNLAALLYKYFSDMRDCFAEMERVLKPGGLCVVVIGNNYTTAGGQSVSIPTDELLVDIADTTGLRLWRMLDMTDQPAYLPHSQNAIRSESIIFLRKPER